MTIPFWCVLVAGVLPDVWVTIAARERARQFGTVDNKLPRPQALKLTGVGARAIGAHNNAFEVLPFFIGGVLIPPLSRADPTSAPDLSRSILPWPLPDRARCIIDDSDALRL